ncbi:holocytochrome-c synthase [Synchytrium microbalum]|uniref:Holocytochrome c-type synthase n=1 Tax=Synchytrium microbalum TaxID=1806994 RepID=A0A507BVA6_9FUNG|nr:holocytochrome-c synthase [Synchytrium microbalum]TPX31101.1 holocytochrome-c synthase [Synchytrium microbalum]
MASPSSSWWPFASTASPSSTTATSLDTKAAASCPVPHGPSATMPANHPIVPAADRKSAEACPIDHSKFQKPSTSNKDPAACPIPHDKSTPDTINPLNMMPTLSQDMSPGQQVLLSTKRSDSTIPKTNAEEHEPTWVYPSPQQFYNALRRKGWETPENDVPTMVAIHNFLNEACWQEILKWEKVHECDCKTPKLARFMGKPSTLSPKATMMTWFGVEKPFDRHDWVVDRCGKEVRYVIDYYSGHDEPESPVFHVDVRPALDSPEAFVDRARMSFQGIWDRCFATTSSAANN